MNNPTWLKDAVFYEIYPQTFCDSNGDGIGDIKGMISKLDYISSLGCNALWINPVYDSSFKDAGYDVRDYKKIAERYGTNQDMYDFFSEAHKRNIKVLMDLVPGHTSDEHEWFVKSKQDETNEYAKRYVWTSHAFEGIPEHPYIAGGAPRCGAYMLNFFLNQPALNYGWGVVCYPWQSSTTSKEALETREALKDIMRFWLDKGCDGFRCDMADSLVKNDDDNKHATAMIWRDIRNMLDKDYPEAALVSEWSNPYSAIHLGGFHMDFYLDHHHNGYNTLLRDGECNEVDRSYFKKDSGGDIQRFLDDYLPKYNSSRFDGYISMFTCNHDTPRIQPILNTEEAKLFYAFLFTMPGVPFLYYGDEIGIAYVEQESKEGGYHRTGSRTPMKWNRDKNFGFSTCEKDQLYTKQDERDDCSDVASQEANPTSLLNITKHLISLRHEYEDLQATNNLEVLQADKALFIYKRGDMICALNTSSQQYTYNITNKEVVYSMNEATYTNNTITLKGPSFIVLK